MLMGDSQSLLAFDIFDYNLLFGIVFSSGFYHTALFFKQGKSPGLINRQIKTRFFISIKAHSEGLLILLFPPPREKNT